MFNHVQQFHSLHNEILYLSEEMLSKNFSKQG